MYNLRLTSIFTAALLLAACHNNIATNSNTTQSATAQQGSATGKPVKTVLFFGDSLTAGYGLDDPADDSFPSVLQTKIDSAKLPYKVINAGVSGETSAGGKARIDWTLKQKVDVFVLELGANDGLRGVPVSETQKNLQYIVDHVKANYPNAKLVMLGMQMPPSMGVAYTSAFKAVFSQVANQNHMTLVPFLLQGVGGVPSLNQADGIHPTAAGDKIVANNVWQVLKRVL